MSVIHAFSCRAENSWNYVSVCGTVWPVRYMELPQSTPGQPFRKVYYVTQRIRVGEEPPMVTCRLCIRRIKARQECAHRDADVLQPYHAHTSDGRCVEEPKVRIVA